MKKVLSFLFALLLVTPSGCGYTLKATPPHGLETIYVETFQNDPDCGVFLISLKAGGLGLNLTAADYVFLLDPWWNPAAETQAIDRAHRVGQTRQVFAYRLICSNTVEEKIAKLQQRKRNLADAILQENNRVLKDLSMDDLNLLFS